MHYEGPRQPKLIEQLIKRETHLSTPDEIIPEDGAPAPLLGAGRQIPAPSAVARRAEQARVDEIVETELVFHTRLENAEALLPRVPRSARDRDRRLCWRGRGRAEGGGRGEGEAGLGQNRDG